MELSESGLSVLFRKPLDAEMQSAVIGAVEAIVKERGDAAKPSGTQTLQTAAAKPVTGSVCRKKFSDLSRGDQIQKTEYGRSV